MDILLFDFDNAGPEELAFATTQQLIVLENSESDRMITYGSGFLLEYRERLFCVTADHIIHPEDHYDDETGQRKRIEYCPQIVTNLRCQDEIGSRNIPFICCDWTKYVVDQETVSNPEKMDYVIQKIYTEDIDMYDENLPLGVAIATIIDIAFSEIEPGYRTLTTELKMGDKVLVPANTLKVPLQAEYITDFNTDDSYFVSGILNRGFRSAVDMETVYMRHMDMKFEGFDSDGSNALLKVSGSTDIENWEGLSGAPVFNYEAELVGMLVRHPGDNKQAEVIPIKTIIEYIDRYIAYESNQID